MKFFLVTLLAAAASAYFAPLHTAKERVDGSYIVVLHDGVDLQYSITTIKNMPFFTTLGGRIDRVYGSALNGFSASLSERTVEMIRRFDFVKYVEEDRIMRASAVASWGLDRIDKEYLPLDGVYNYTGHDGSDVNVYVIDSGINYGHEDFESRAVKAFDIYSGDGVDCNGHGTHCAGTVGGLAHGVAKAANLHNVRVLDCFASGIESDVIYGMNWVAANRILPAVALMGLGGEKSQAVNDAVKDMDSANVTVIVAAGNNYADACDYSPASAEQAYCVGATDRTDARASYSNYGSCLNIFAPGEEITSCWIDSETDSRIVSGTSMAASHVAGASAIILGVHPEYSPSEVKHILDDDAVPSVVSDPGASSPNFLLHIHNEHEHEEDGHEDHNH